MKKATLIITMLVAADAAVAQISSIFRSYDELTAQSPEIVIARCSAAFPQYGLFDIEVVSVLKGGVGLGASHLQTERPLHQGEEFVIFSERYSDDSFYHGYTALEEDRVVLLKTGFSTNALTGKTLSEQIQSILPAPIKAEAAKPLNAFTSWDDLIDRSTDIMIAQCKGTPWNATREHSVRVYDGLYPFDIEVLSVLKGNARLGPARMASSPYWPSLGDRFLVFANFRKDQYVTNYTVAEAYRVVPLNHFFQTNGLSGKSLPDQIQWIRKIRLRDLNDELAKLNDALTKGNEEKSRLLEGLKEEDKELGASSNAPPAVRGGF